MGGGDIFGSEGRLASKTRENGGYRAKKMRYPSRAAHGSKSSYRNDQ